MVKVEKGRRKTLNSYDLLRKRVAQNVFVAIFARFVKLTQVADKLYIFIPACRIPSVRFELN